MKGIKIGNEYAHAMGKFYADTPKAVFAALAYSFAGGGLGLSPDDVVARLRDEWRILNENGIVPQKPEAR